MSKTTKMIAALGIVAGLGVAAMPLGAFAAQPYDQADGLNTPKDDTASVTFTAVVDPVVSIRVDAAAQTISSIAPHAADETKTTTATISTNDEGGWKLYAKDANGGTLNKAAGTGVSAKTIDAYAGTLAAGTSAFGFKVSATARGAQSESEGTITNGQAAYAAFGTTDALIASADKRAADDTVTVTYGVSTADDQAAGTYTDTITYTAHTNTD